MPVSRTPKPVTNRYSNRSGPMVLFVKDAAEGSVDKKNGAFDVHFEVAFLYAYDNRAVFLFAGLQLRVRFPALVHGVLDMGAEDGKQAQHKNPGPAIVGVSARQPLEKTRARGGKEIKQGIQQPIHCRQGNPDQYHEFGENFKFWTLKCLAIAGTER